MRIDFVKCHGSGNDFPLVDARAIALSNAQWAAVARALADRAGPVGSDGLLLLTAGDAAHAFGMRMFNPDGSEAETCLNGLRCVARAGFAATGAEAAAVKLATSSAEVARAPDLAPGIVTIRETVGPAGLDAHWAGGADRIVESVVPGLPGGPYTALSIPNPHFIHFTHQVDEAALVAVGEICEAAPAWLPARANVSFVEVRGRDLFVRTFERGVGLTNSCGSAMAASAYAACLTGRLSFGQGFTVFNAGGLVMAEAAADGMVTLAGNATFEWEGSAEIDLAQGRAGDLRIARHFNDEIAAWGALVDGIATKK
ncbi:MAG: diaminopimelate epimerase [Proteobacteria bacterium SG_bin5]|nr:MAG: diaminopimelate epimerase [Proteobacteria bacterium SG_bin5]